MNVEVIEFYPAKKCDSKNLIEGTMHVYIQDLDLDLRGIKVKMTKKRFWFFQIPHRRGWDPETQQMVKFPLISFPSKEKHRELIKQIYEKGKEYIESMQRKGKK